MQWRGYKPAILSPEGICASATKSLQTTYPCHSRDLVCRPSHQWVHVHPLAGTTLSKTISCCLSLDRKVFLIYQIHGKDVSQSSSLSTVHTQTELLKNSFFLKSLDSANLLFLLLIPCVYRYNAGSPLHLHFA